HVAGHGGGEERQDDGATRDQHGVDEVVAERRLLPRAAVVRAVHAVRERVEPLVEEGFRALERATQRPQEREQPQKTTAEKQQMGHRHARYTPNRRPAADERAGDEDCHVVAFSQARSAARRVVWWCWSAAEGWCREGALRDVVGVAKVPLATLSV